jgi:hypothetical protein
MRLPLRIFIIELPQSYCIFHQSGPPLRASPAYSADNLNGNLLLIRCRLQQTAIIGSIHDCRRNEQHLAY